MTDATVRIATADDAAAIARIQVRTWRTAYAEALGRATVEALDEDALTAEWAAAVGHAGSSVFVALEGSELVGFCAAGPAPDSDIAAADGTPPDDAGSVALISTVLVEPRWGRRGHGGRLFGTAAHALRAGGHTRGVTWTAQSDSASLSFFRSVGWNPDGTVRTLDTGERTVRELRLTGGLDVHFDTDRVDSATLG
ncbi:GNAT family N-acetyltransferase [Saccharomonospora sp. CUA-673]|uniref:GNAT family N-acetyltransferase n=1 Tax=Saccharomonospora sp. CUA-673 TaxID=1904969 RepID=UPI0009664A68|nr:GNAT family N-acetyltransferase [Saccharomonospora sp. CUA-673]OLT38497.1 GNAT family N-acetyltransferase [Saccharomonospora sp. CUA-673]